VKYKSVIVTRRGGPDVLQVKENDLRMPRKGEVRVRVRAVPVCAPDVTARYGQSPFIPKPPFTPGYAIIGEVDAVGAAVGEASVGDRVGALTVYGGYAEYVYLRESELIPVPAKVEAAGAATLIMNYLVAYQSLHRLARVKAGEKVLFIGASGGIGTAFLQLGKLAHLVMYGVASRSKEHILLENDVTPIDYHTQDFVEVIHQLEPDGLDAVFDGMAGDYFKRGFSVLRDGGRLVGYGNPTSYSGMFKVLAQTLLFNLLPNGKTARYYSTGSSRLNRRPFLEDWATLFKLLEDGDINPIIAKTYPLVEAAQANAYLEGGQVIGNVVLLA
jgi:NADPH:quinone reductase-like Zn-dependent oxidoreductase